MTTASFESDILRHGRAHFCTAMHLSQVPPHLSREKPPYVVCVSIVGRLKRRTFVVRACVACKLSPFDEDRTTVCLLPVLLVCAACAKQDNSKAQEVLRIFLKELKFKNASLDEALRAMVMRFRLPGEAQQMDRFVP